MLCAGDTLLALGPIFPEVGQASGYLRFMTERHARIYICARHVRGCQGDTGTRPCSASDALDAEYLVAHSHTHVDVDELRNGALDC